jgi:hypothetical protein
MEETLCQWVSSRGLLKSCDKRNREPASSSRHIDPDLLAGVQDYDVVHICSWLTITLFIKNVVPQLEKKIIVVSNDSDMDAPIFEKPVGVGDEIAKEEILAFINSEKCVHWFTQNCSLNHPKVSAIPIGMDYHTFKHYSNCVAQETQLNSIRARGKPFETRMPKCYGNYQFGMHGKYYTAERLSCYDDVPRDLTYYEPNPVPRSITWERQSLFGFVLSPAGGGMDCHRTWEALLLGCIPIVKRFNVPCDSIYDGLPVLLVDEWRDVTADLLQKTLMEFQSKRDSGEFKMERLTLQYWMEKIRSFKPDRTLPSN